MKDLQSHQLDHWREQLREAPTQYLDRILIEGALWFEKPAPGDLILLCSRDLKVGHILTTDAGAPLNRCGGLFDFLHKMRRLGLMRPARLMAAE